MEKQLREHLEELHTELESADAMDERSKDLIDSVVRDIQKLLDREPGTSHQPQGLIERLRDATRHFEENHPDLSAAVGRVMNTLSNMGI